MVFLSEMLGISAAQGAESTQHQACHDASEHQLSFSLAVNELT